MVGSQINAASEKPVLSSKHIAFLDPNIGLYCFTLATKNSLRNVVGEQNTAVLGRWATLMTATALKRSGLPVSLFYSSCYCNMVYMFRMSIQCFGCVSLGYLCSDVYCQMMLDIPN